MNIDLTGRTALITGGSKGLGLATAIRLAKSGANVAIMARDKAALAEAEAAIRHAAAGGRALALAGDVMSSEQLEAVYARVKQEFGGVDILINNAGKATAVPFSHITDDMWESDLQLKLMAMVRLTRLAWPDMVERKWGRVINVLNTFSKTPMARTAPTSVTRAAQLALTNVLAQEGAPHNVLVNAMLVGLIKSEQIVRAHQAANTGDSLEEYARQTVIKAGVPMRRIGEAEEFANMACFLVSDAASYITGTAINVDGGMSPVI